MEYKIQNPQVALSDLEIQAKVLKEILSQAEPLVKTLNILQEESLPNWYVGGGSIPQIVWNYYHDYDLCEGVKDFDIVYYDPEDISAKMEQEREANISRRYPDSPAEIEAVNEARTHIWYEEDFGKVIEPYISTEGAIYHFPTTASAVGVTLTGDGLKVYAPHGLTDLLGLVVRANKVQIQREVYEAKCQRWKEVWPKLTIISWQDDYKYVSSGS